MKRFSLVCAVFGLLCLSNIQMVYAQNKSKKSKTPTPSVSQPPATASAQKDWDIFAKTFTKDFFDLFPEYAIGAGSHDYDSVLVVPTEDNRNAQRKYLEKKIIFLNNMITQPISASNKIDAEIMRNEFQQIQFYLNKYKSYEWNPAEFNVCGTFSEILANTKIPYDERMRNLSIRLKKVPAYYESAKATLQFLVPEFRDLAIAQHKGGMAVFDELRDSLSKSKMPDEQLNTALLNCSHAKTTVELYVETLTQKQWQAKRDFRLGDDLYQEKFALSILTGATANQAYQSALERKQFLHFKMHEYAKLLADKYLGNEPRPKATDSLGLIKAVINKISLSHCKPADFQEEIRTQIPTLQAFVSNKDLLYQDPTKPLVVRKEPDYMAGVAGASISAPGPLESIGNTYYNVGSLAAKTPAEQESYLREYNNYTLQILNIHEAIPGHYTQLVYANKNPSIIRSLFGNGATIEGWAVFSELMMLENGYGNNAAEMWLMYYKWNLRTVCNTIIDYSIHTQKMEEASVLNLLMNEAFQTEAEAKGKWKRATLSSVQLTSYFTGFDAILQLRDDYRKKMGDAYSVKKFNETFLSYGSAPLYLIRKEMLGE